MYGSEPQWFLTAERQLCEAYDKGDISESEFESEMRNLRDELRSCAEEAAVEAYNDTMGFF